MTKKQTISTIIKSFFITWALLRVASLSIGSIFTLIFFFGSYALFYFSGEYFNKVLQEPESVCRRKISVVSTILGLLFALFIILPNFENYTGDLSNGLFKAIIITAVFAGMFFLFTRCLILLYIFITQKNEKSQKEAAAPKTYRGIAFLFDKYTIIFSTVLCMIFFIPFFLYSYPGILSPDSINQIEQALGEVPLSNHHPYLHTLIIKMWVDLGMALTGNLAFGVALYTVFQMIIMALTCGYAVDTVKKITGKLWTAAASMIIYAAVPIFDVYSIIMWKDIPFGLSVLVMICALLRIQKACHFEVKPAIIDYILLGISGIGICLLRSNGFYAFIISIPFLLIGTRKKKLPLWPIIVGVLGISLLFRGPVLSSLNVRQPDFVESIAVPSQLVAQVLVNDRTLPDKDIQMIENIVDLTYIHELYVPGYADNIKELMRAGHPEYLESHKKEFLELFIRTGFSYPQDYLQALVSQTKSVWYPEVFYNVSYNEGIAGNNWNLITSALIGGPVVMKVREIYLKLGTMIPILGLMWSMGTLTWIILICFGSTLVAKKGSLKRETSYIFTILIMLIFSLVIAIPVMEDYRYMFFALLALPVVLGLL